MAYNTGPFRMDGHGSLAGYLAYGDANGITLELGRRLLPVVEDTPVVGGIGAADPYRDVERLLDEYLAVGFSGITNVPTAGLYGGDFRRHIDATGLGYPREIDLIRLCRERDVFTVAYAFTPDDGPEAWPQARPVFVSGRHLTWYGPSLVEAPELLVRQLSG